MVVGLGDAAARRRAGDAGRGRRRRAATVVARARRRARVRTPRAQAMARGARARARGCRRATLPAVTRDGRRSRVLANVAARAEVAPALDAGAEGVGLLRTELRVPRRARVADRGASTGARSRRCSRGSRGRTATVRVLDFGGDKTPPFLPARRERGLALLLARARRARGAAARDRRAGAATPTCASCSRWSRRADGRRRACATAACAARPLAIGAMIETPAAVADAAAIAARRRLPERSAPTT